LRKRKQARRLLDEPYRGFPIEIESRPPNDESHAESLRGPTPRDNTSNSANSNNSNNNNNSINNDNSNITASSPLPPPPQSPPSSQPPSPPRSPIPPIVEPDFPHSALTQRIFPDSPPPSIRSPSPPSYSPISSPEEPPRPASPANSTTSSVEFVEEVHIPPPRPRHYYHYHPHEPLDSLIQQFPLRTTPLPPDFYSIGPDDLDLHEIRTVISGQDPDAIIPVFLPTSPFPHDVPIRFFYNLFPPSTANITELSE